MPVFAYRVARPDGSTLDGQIEGEEEHLVRAKLEGQGFLVFRLQRRGAATIGLGLGWHAFGKLPLQEFLVFNQEIPHPQHGKTGLHEGEQLLIEHQEFLKRELAKRVPPQTQTGCGHTPSLQPKDEEALALQFGPDEVFFLSLNLSIEG